MSVILPPQAERLLYGYLYRRRKIQKWYINNTLWERPAGAPMPINRKVEYLRNFSSSIIFSIIRYNISNHVQKWRYHRIYGGRKNKKRSHRPVLEYIMKQIGIGFYE